MGVKSADKPVVSSFGIVITLAVGAIVVAAMRPDSQASSPRPAVDTRPSPSDCATADSKITTQVQPHPVSNPASADQTQTFTLLGRWSDTELGVEITWITDGANDPAPGKYPYRSGTAYEKVVSHGGKVGLTVTLLHPDSRSCGYLECEIIPHSNSPHHWPKPLVANITRRSNTAVSCFLES